MIRTTEAAVAAIIEVDVTIPLAPFIETASNVVDAVCTHSSYSDTTLELIERWLSAHFYAVRDPRVTREAVKGIEEVFAISVKDYGFNTTPYGQQALMIDVRGNLKILSEGKGNLPIQIVQIGGDNPCPRYFGRSWGRG